ncbi:MAG: Holliday junction branch migration protein RuvA [Methylophilaceae bacterium]|nr:Holliday junction branch migration protein RuvA [Methylophilaceae bacterium]MBL6726804.1 Holliday junction branch migration protein RuvA [Methylophilaceae bacterium]MBL6729096.1 Holliday junction branch migration protein RuvA [Methylophilaceae bacterium]MBL6791324.1 Holliday junction branch migration protein RuvA [Methylophilaceae bacterium]
MIGHIKGFIVNKKPTQVLIDCNGVGYEVDVPMSTFYDLPTVGEQVTLLTHLIVREDAHLLFGFATSEEREVFRQLIKVNGVGAKVALSILSGISLHELVDAIMNQNSNLLVSIPGIGNKTAERLVLELKGKLANIIDDKSIQNTSSETNDIQNALISLGYSTKEAISAVKNLPSDISINDGIKDALKFLSRKN